MKGKKKGSLHKNRLRQYLIGKLGVGDLTLNTWANDLKKVEKEVRSKFNIRYVTQAKKENGSG